MEIRKRKIVRDLPLIVVLFCAWCFSLTRVPPHVVFTVPIPVHEDAVEEPGSQASRGFDGGENSLDGGHAVPRRGLESLAAVADARTDVSTRPIDREAKMSIARRSRGTLRGPLSCLLRKSKIVSLLLRLLLLVLLSQGENEFFFFFEGAGALRAAVRTQTLQHGMHNSRPTIHNHNHKTNRHL